MQLYIMAVFYEIFGESVRGHGLRTLLGILSRDLKKHGYESMSAEVDHFVNEYRRYLIAAEEAYIGGRYGELGYSEEDSRRLRDVAKKLIRLLDEVVESVKLGLGSDSSIFGGGGSTLRAFVRLLGDILGEDVEVYVVGGVAEKRATVLSDIDILIVASELPRDRKRLYCESLGRAIDVYGSMGCAGRTIYLDKRRAEEYLETGRRVEMSID
jgi:HEPN domain-containing protein